MFEGKEFPKSLDEQSFNDWLEKGRESKIGYKYLLIIWDQYDSTYQPVYLENREAISEYNKSTFGREKLVAAYDLYSESRIL
jgi:hypothetical protein